MNKKLGFGERLNDIFKASGMGRDEFAHSIGLTSGTTLANYFSENRSPSLQTLHKLAERQNVNLHWLLTGNGASNIGSNVVSIPLATTSDEFNDEECLSFERKFFQDVIGIQPLNLVYHVINDDAMSETLAEGDMVIANTELGFKTGLFVCSIDEEIVVRRIQKHIEGYVVSCDNSAYQPFLVKSTTPAEKFKLIGKVVYHGHRLMYPI